MNSATTSPTCSACRRLNLPGGVRCIYCGTHFPPSLDFDLGVSGVELPPQQPPPSAAVEGRQQTVKQGRAAGVVSSLAVLLLKGKSLLSLLKFGKIALTLSTMLLSMVAYAQIYQWRFAVGFVVCILIHELGHVFVNWRKGIPATAPMFIPFVGAVIFVKGFPDNPTAESECGMGGPFAGMLAALVCLAVALMTRDPLWMALANTGFIINLFNLMPFPPLDGSHIGSVFSPKMWSGALIVLLLWVLKVPSAMLWLVLIVGFLLRLGRTDEGRYRLAPPHVRIRMVVLYVLLCIGLGYGSEHTLTPRPYKFASKFSSLRASVQNRQTLPPSPAFTDHNETRTVSVTTPAPGASTTLEQSEASNPPVSSARSAASGVIMRFLRTCLVVLAGGLWIMAAFLLRAAAKAPLTARVLILPGLMLALLCWLASGQLPYETQAVAVEIQYAYVAAALAAIVYAGYQAYHLQKIRLRPGHLAEIVRCLAWAGAGALLVAYVMNSSYVALWMLVFAVIFYIRYPWMLPSMAARIAESIGQYGRALSLLDLAITLKPEKVSLAELWKRIVHLNLLLDRGGKALEALEEREAVLKSGTDNVDGNVINPEISDLETRSIALTLLGRYDEALACCERMLQVDTGTPLGPLRLLTVRSRLARMAYYRGWYDEALVQSDLSILATPTRAKTFLARLLTGRAAAQAAVGNAEAAHNDCAQALAAHQDPYVLAWVAVIRAQLFLHAGNLASADRETQTALQHMPESLSFRYWRGRVLMALQRAEGRVMLSDLASAYPAEHWGRLAAACIGTGSTL